jgi:hypothetical protein
MERKKEMGKKKKNGEGRKSDACRRDSRARRAHAARGDQRGGKENASAPIAAAAAAGRPRARGIRTLREIGLAPALIAESGRARLS